VLVLGAKSDMAWVAVGGRVGKPSAWESKKAATKVTKTPKSKKMASGK
jgi:hypothetical protein